MRWLLGLLFAVSVAAQPLTIKDFKGLNTASSDFNTQPNELRLAHDVDFSRNGIGTMSPRLGIVEVARIAGIDSILGLFTMNYRNGDKQLFLVTDSAGVGYGNIYSSELNSDAFNLVFTQSTDSTFIAMRARATDSLIGFSENSTTWNYLIIIDSFFVKNDTAVIVDSVLLGGVDSATSHASWLTSNDSLVARINAHATLSNYVTAGLGASPHADTTYYFKETYSDTSVTFRTSFTILFTDGFQGQPEWAEIQTVTKYLGTSSVVGRPVTQWSVQRPTSFAQFNDLAYFVNGQQKGVVYNGDYVSLWPTAAPSEIAVVPLKQGDEINGEVMYALAFSLDSTDFSNSYIGYLTPRTRIISGRALLKDFQVPALPTATDTFSIKIYRTKTTAGRITESDYVYLHSQRNHLNITNNSIYTLTVIDSLANDDLGTDSVQIIDLNLTGREGDTAFGAAELRYGAPTFISGDSVASADSGVYKGTSTDFTIGVAYVVSYIDTANGIASDSSRSLVIFRDTSASGIDEKQYTIALPKPSSNQNIVKNIWRTQVFVASWDSLDIIGVRQRDTSRNYINIIDPTTGERVGQELAFNRDSSAVERILSRPGPSLRFDLIAKGDTIIDFGNYKLVAQVPDSQTTYTDRISQDSLDNSPFRFEFNQPPSGLEFVKVINGQLVGGKDSRLWKSRTGELTQWELFDFSAFNLDDGDHVTMVEPFRGGVLVGKTYSAFNWLPDFTTIEVAGIPGCVAEDSPIRANGAIYYLSNSGIISLAEGAALIRHHESGLISDRLRNFTDKEFADLTSCVGAYVPQREQLWWCIGDTTYVYDIRADAWSTSSLTFAGAALYDVDTLRHFIPGRSLYFFQSGDSVIYKFGEGNREANGSYVDMQVESGPIFTDAERQQINSVALWAQPEETYSVATLNFFNEGDTLLLGTYASLRVDRRISLKEIAINPAIYYRYKIKTLVAGFPMRDGGIDRLDIYYSTTKEVGLE